MCPALLLERLMLPPELTVVALDTVMVREVVLFPKLSVPFTVRLVMVALVSRVTVLPAGITTLSPACGVTPPHPVQVADADQFKFPAPEVQVAAGAA